MWTALECQDVRRRSRRSARPKRFAEPGCRPGGCRPSVRCGGAFRWACRQPELCCRSSVGAHLHWLRRCKARRKPSFQVSFPVWHGLRSVKSTALPCGRRRPTTPGGFFLVGGGRAVIAARRDVTLRQGARHPRQAEGRRPGGQNPNALRAAALTAEALHQPPLSCWRRCVICARARRAAGCVRRRPCASKGDPRPAARAPGRRDALRAPEGLRAPDRRRVHQAHAFSG